LADEQRPPDELLNRALWRIPNVLCLIGSRAGDEWNSMTASWVTQAAMEPVLIAVSVDVKAVTHRLIVEGRRFSVNLWDREDTRPFVKFSKPARKVGMELNGYAIREGMTGAPIMEDAVVWFDCTLWNSIDAGTHTVFLGEVQDAGFRADDDDPLVARMEDTRMKYGGVKRGGH
jgi:flavin reductase (DIM6/NTAB) family NADH-FMN oxidoreductase RutF